MSIERPAENGSRRAAQLEETRRALIAAARQQFGVQGYAAAEVGVIAAAAGVTTGPLYHHFNNKLGLFTAVAESIEEELLRIAASAEGATPWLALRAGLTRLVTHCAAADIRRILLVEAPQVIGPAAWREIELRYAYGAMRATLETLMADGVLRVAPVELVARLLLTLLGETAAALAAARDPVTAEQALALFNSVLDALEMPAR